MTPAQALFGLAGSPAMEPARDSEARCAICAQSWPRTAPYGEWQGGNYTDQNKVKLWGADAICEPCIWAHAWVSPPGYVPTDADAAKKAAKRATREAAGEAMGDARPVNLRLFSHLWSEAGGYIYANKAGKATIRTWLRAPKVGPWFAAIADSGQKHVLPWTRMNIGGACGVARFETTDVVLGDWAIVDAMTALLTDGVTKEELGRGEYRRGSWATSADALLAFEQQHGAALRGSAWWDLALWLSQREEAEYERRANGRREEKRVADAGRRATHAGARRVSGRRREPAQALGPDPGPGPDRVPHEREHGAVGDDTHAESRARRPEQASLFGD